MNVYLYGPAVQWSNNDLANNRVVYSTYLRRKADQHDEIAL